MNGKNTLSGFFCLLLLSFVASSDTFIWQLSDRSETKDTKNIVVAVKGSLEVRKNQGNWMTICNAWTDENVKNVACRQMGFLGTISSTVKGTEQTNIISQNFSCPTGNENDITFCTIPTPSSDKCPTVFGTTSLAVEVLCKTNLGLLGLLNVELQGDNVHSGTLEYTRNGKKTPVCYDDPNAESVASVVCKQMGYSDKVNVSSEAANATEFASLECSGSEQTLDTCTFKNHVSSCAKSLVMAVECKLNMTSQNVFDVRLSSPDKSASQGTVEVWKYGHWGVICDNDWTIEDASVVCRQLGYRKATDAPKNALYGQGTGVVFWDKMMCTGNEFSIEECSHTTAVVSATCDSTKAAGVSCDTNNPITHNYICTNGTTPISIPAGVSFLQYKDGFSYGSGTTCYITSTNLTATDTLTLYIQQKMFQANHVESLIFYSNSSAVEQLYGDDSSAGPFSFTNTDNFTIQFKSRTSAGEGKLKILIKATAAVEFTSTELDTTTTARTTTTATSSPSTSKTGESIGGEPSDNAGLIGAVTAVVVLVILAIILGIILWKLGFVHFGRKARNPDGNGLYDETHVPTIGEGTGNGGPGNCITVGGAYGNVGEPVYVNSTFVADMPTNTGQDPSSCPSEYENLGEIAINQGRYSGHATPLAEPVQGGRDVRNHGNGANDSTGVDETEPQYAKLEPVNRSEYVDFRGLTAEQLKPI